MQVICLHDMTARFVAVTGPGVIPGLWHFNRTILFPGAHSKNP